MRGKKFSSPRDTNNSDAIAIKNVIQEIAQEEIKKFGFPTYKAAIVRKLNDDGTVDCYLPPNEENLVTGILNKSGELLFVGDSVELETKNGSLTNCWVAIKHGTNVQGQAAEVATLSGEVVMKVQNGRLSVTELNRDANLGNAFTIIAEDINLDGMNIVLNGSRGITITSPYFNVTSQGYITATGGKIGGWEMGSTRLYSGSGATYVALDSGTQGVDYPIWAGNENPANAPFSVTRAGAIKSTSGNIGGWTVNNSTLTAGNITLNSNGSMSGGSTHTWSIGTDGAATFNNITANSGTFSGTINASGGTITGNMTVTGTLSGGTISGSAISGGTISGSAISGGSLSGSSISGGSINIGNGVFSVNSAGRMVCYNSGGGYLSMNAGTTHPYASGLNVGSAVVINGKELSISNDRLRCYGDFQAANFYCLGNVQCNNYIAGNDINLLAGGSSGSASGGGILLRTGKGGHITLDAANGGGTCYAHSNGYSNSRIYTAAEAGSSRNIKKNILKFDKNDYQDAFNLLKNIDIYSYDYKYDLYKKRNQYGFIIDEIEKNENYDKFFDFHSEKASVYGEHLDFSMEETNIIPDDIIEVKQYDRDVLDKFMLTCLKAMQNKIEEQDKEIQELKNIIKNIVV